MEQGEQQQSGTAHLQLAAVPAGVMLVLVVLLKVEA